MCAQQTGMWLGRALVVFLLLLAAMPYDAAAQGPEPAELLVESVTLFPPGGEREQSNVLARVTLSSRARLRWTERAGVPSPPARDRMAAVANTNEQTIVLFGGRQDGSTPLGDTWIWDGARWTQANTAGKPAGRSEHAMAYAYDRSAVAMFGGRGENGAGLTDTWEFDGIDWNQMQPSTSPSGRWGHGLAADDSRKRVVLFGGRASPDGAPSNDTWEWDGQEWTDVTPATSPPARSGHAMFYDRRRQRVVVAGGEQAGCIGLADVWEWNGTVWTDVTPKTGPSPGSRRGASAAYDYENYGRTLLYGGEELVGCDWTARRDVWAWNGASWTDVTPPSAVAPAARSGQVFTYDFYNDGFLLFGGYDGAHWLQDTWGFEAPTGSVSSTSELTASLVFEGDPAGYRVRPAPENVTLVAGGDSATLSFSVDVTREAAIGPRSLAVTVSARDDDFSIPTLVVNLVKGAFMVNPRPARLAIGTVAAAPTRVSRGQTVNVTVSVENMGDESGDLSAGGLTFNGLESGYSVQRLDANTSLAGLTTATLSYDVTVTEAAPAGPAIVDAWLEQRDQRADNPDEWRVQTRASLSVESVELGADRVHRGDRDVPAQVRVRSEVPSTWRKVNAVERLMRRGNHAMAYDSDRGRTVVFGGSYGPDRLRDTWEFDGSAWLDVTPKDSASPKGRMGASMAYDAVRHRTVLFGGSSAKGALRDTWEWDGSQWLDATPAGPSPSRRSNHTMAFDPSRGRVVLFGGVDDVGSNLGTVGDTWEWDGTTWAQKSPPGGTSPQPRYKHAMAFAGSRGRVVLFGGYNPDLGAYFGDLWEWDGTSWADVSPLTGPSGRIPSAMAWDGGRNRLVLHGCFTVDPQVGGMVPQDTWEWDGSQWLDLSQEKEPSPSGSPDCAAVYDSRRARTVMLGGERPESWEWNGTSWTETTPSKPPEPRSNSSLAFEPASGSTWLFGGYGRDTGALSDTWGWNGSRWARANPASSPTPRWSVASVADTSRHRIVLFGGYNSGEGHLADTWEFDGTNWSNVTPDYSPPARESHAMAYDSRRGRTVLFGGQGDPDVLGHTWEWDGSAWADVTPVTGAQPPGRWAAAVAYDASRNRVILHGGYVGNGAVSDLWEWDGTTWTDCSSTVANQTRPLVHHRMVYDTLRHRAVLFGGYDIETNDRLGDTWELGPEPDSGASTVQLTAALQFAGNAAGYKAAPRPANPTTLACGETAVLTFAVEVTGASSPGPRTVTAVVAGKDANSGAAASVANTAAATWTIVPGPARLAVRSVAAAPVKVSRGQTVSPVSVVVANTGETAARVWSSGLVFGAGSSGYSVTPVSVETTLAAAATATFTYAVTVRETAPLGATAIDATVSAADVATGSPAGDSSADVTDTWLVQTPAALTLAPLSCPATVLRGTAFRATASLTNQGQAKAFPVDLTLSWGLPGLRVTPVGVPPVELDGGQSAAWAFDVSMPLTSALAPVGGNVTAIGTDANSGLVLHATTIGTVLPANHSPVALLATPAPAAFAAGVQLDASASYDGPAPDRSEGDPLSYRWAIAARPAGSSATASAFSVNATTGAARPLFRPDVPGSYRLSLVVSDGTDSSASAVVDALLENTAPVARAVASAPVPAGETVVLDGRSSFDAETPTSLIYRWSFASVPAGSLLTDGNIVPNASALAGRASFRTDRKGVYAIGLLVSDGFLDSAPAPVTVTATNRPPVASIAAPGEGLCFQSLTLAATGSSDPDGDALTYDWSFTSLPAGSALTTASMTPNGSASAATTAFVPDRPGTFAIALVARDAEAASPPAHWSIQVQPALPEAHAGADVTARVTQTVTLDGSASVSPGNQPMTYRWRFVSVPPNSRVTTASLSSNDATRAATTSFRPDRKGLYRLSLVVVTQQGASPPDRVDATAVNSGPAARTGADQTVALRRPVTLSGAGSSDPDAEDTLSFSWSLRSVPSGSRLSTSALVPNSSPGSAHTSFVPDVPGSYEVGLVVDDGIEPSARSLTRITAVNARPIAACSASGPAAVTQPVELDGSSSSDPDPDTALVYHWDLASRPAGSQLTTASLAPNDSASASLSRFQPDRKGLYVVRLIVSDGIASSVPATALVDAGNSPPAASLALVTVSPQANRDVVLDASQSSDPDLQDALSYGWRLSSRPQGSALQEISIAPLNPNQPWRARFVPDRAGSYSVRLIVSDATASTASERTVAVLPQPNPPPVATIRAQSLAGGPQVLQLDGRGSRPGATTRPIAAYRWRLAAAPAEARTLASSSATVSYDARAAGSYTFELTVTDISGLSGSVRVGASVTNVTPTAQAGPDSELLLYRPGLPPELGTTTTVRLNGRRSADANGTPLVYTWRVVLAPDKSVAQAAETTLAAIDDAHSAAPRISFRTDLVAESGGRFRLAAAGGYWVRLTVSDGEREEADEVAITALDPAALLSWADAGIETFDRVQFLPGGGIAPTVPDPTIVPALDASGNARNLRAHIRLDGHESADPTGLPLKYRWSVALDGEGRPLVPAGSAPPILSGADTATPSFVPAAEGMYTFELIVDNGRHSSWPDRVRVTIGSTNLSPRADIVAEDLETLQRVTPRDALTAFTLGHRIVLRGDGSSDPDPGDGAALLYSWTQEAGLRSELGPSTTTGVVSFVPAEPGRYAFSLVVRDPQARESQPEAIDFLVMPEGRPRPQIALTATAPGVSTTGQSMPEQQQDDSPRSLRVKAPVTVTLEARVSGLLPGERSDILWRQLAGPTVALSNVGDRNTVAEASVTTFSPTTSRVHVFEASLEPLDDSGQGTGLRVARRIAVLVDTATSRVPIAIAELSPPLVPAGGTDDQRRVTLDGRRSAAALQSGTTAALQFCWEQIAGPSARIENVYAPLTRAWLPSAGANDTRLYRFALYVDTGLDRSEAFNVSVAQRGSSTSPAAFLDSAGGYRGGGGCAMVEPGEGGRLSDWLPVWVPAFLALLGVRRRRRSMP